MDEICPKCREVLPAESYWERQNDSPTRQECYRVDHWRQADGWCVGMGGPPRHPLDMALRTVAYELAQVGRALVQQLGM